MAGILQLRRGLKSTYISEGTNLAEAFFVTTAEEGSISENNLIIGVSGSVGNDVITVAKLSLANKDNTYADYNSGSFWLTGDYTGSNALIYDNLKVSGSVFIEEDLHLEGHLYLGSGSDGDVVTVKSDFSGSLIPDNDNFGTRATLATEGFHDLGDETKRWRNIYLTKDGTGRGFLSGSHIDLTGNIKVDGEGRFGTLRVDDLTDNRILLVGPGGEVEDDENLTYDGQDFRLTNSDYYQSGSGASFQFDGAGADFTGSISNYQLRVDNGVVFTNEFGTLDNQTQFTWDGGVLDITGGVSASEDLSVGRQAYLASAMVKDLTEDRITIAGQNGELEDDQYFRYTGNDFIIGSAEHFTVQVSSGNTDISGSVQMYSTLNVDDQSTLSSVNVEDLTDNRVVIVGAGGEIEDDGNFTFDGTELNIGTGNFTVQQGSGNTQILGTLDVDSQSTLSSLNVEDLTSGRVVLAGTSGEIEDSGNLTFDGSLLTVTGNTTITGDLTIQGTQTQLNTATLNVEDINILIASGAVDASAANGGGITIDGANATLLYGSSDDSFTFNKLLKVNGNISGSSFNGTTLLSSSNENFADYSQSVDSRLDEIEGPMSTSLDSRLIEIFTTGSDHETRIDEIETTFSSSVDSRISSNDSDIISLGTTNNTQNTNIGNLQLTGSDHETRLVAQELFSTSLDDTFATEAEVNSATSSLSSSLAIDIASNLSEITNLNSFSSSIESHLPDGVVSGSSQLDGITIGTTSEIEASGSFSGSFVGNIQGPINGSESIDVSSYTLDDSVTYDLGGIAQRGKLSGLKERPSNTYSGGTTYYYTTHTLTFSADISSVLKKGDIITYTPSRKSTTTESHTIIDVGTTTAVINKPGDTGSGGSIYYTPNNLNTFTINRPIAYVTDNIVIESDIQFNSGSNFSGNSYFDGGVWITGSYANISPSKLLLDADEIVSTNTPDWNFSIIPKYGYAPGGTPLVNSYNLNYVSLGSSTKAIRYSYINDLTVGTINVQSGSGTPGNVTIDNNLDVGGNISGSSVNITDTINLTAQDPLPSGNVGDLAVSGSNLFFYNGAWTQVV